MTTAEKAMTTAEKALFESALTRTRLKAGVVFAMCLALALVCVASPVIAPGESVGMHGASLALGVFMAAFGLGVGYMGVVKTPARVRRLIHSLESSPHDVVSVTVTVHATRAGQQVTLTEIEALANPPGFNAQWRVEVRLRDDTVSLMPGGRDRAIELASIVRRHAALPTSVASGS